MMSLIRLSDQRQPGPSQYALSRDFASEPCSDSRLDGQLPAADCATSTALDKTRTGEAKEVSLFSARRLRSTRGGVVRGIPGTDKSPCPRITGAFRDRDGGPVISPEITGPLRAVMADSPSPN